MQHFIVNIGREFGALGLEIGKRLAGELGVKYYDRELVKVAARNLHMTTGTGSLIDENPMQPQHGLLSKLSVMETTKYNQFIQAQSQAIRRIAQRESCVFIGRCADFVLRDMEQICLNVFIFAPYEARCNHIIEEYLAKEEYSHRGKTEDDYMAFAWEMHKLVTETDKKRHYYYKYVTGSNRGERHDKHIMLDSAAFGVDGSVDILKRCVMQRFG